MNLEWLREKLSREYGDYLIEPHNAIVKNLNYNIDDQLETRMIKFIHVCLNHDNDVCRSISLSKLLCKNSTFLSN